MSINFTFIGQKNNNLKVIGNDFNKTLEIPSTSYQCNWMDDGVAVCNASSLQEYPQIISDAAGGAIIVWHDNRSGNYDIYAQRINSLGHALWIANGTIICSASGDQLNPQVVQDGIGGAIITWKDHRSSSYDLYGQRINSTGDVQWMLNGKVISNADADQREHKMVIDGEGGAIIAWEDLRSGSSDIYAQKINDGGDTQWNLNGTVICNAADNQIYLTIVGDGEGGAIIAWSDMRVPFPFYVYAQKINATGYVKWGNNGKSVCPAGMSGFTGQLYPDITSDGAGGAIITWMDSRRQMNDWDIHAQKISTSGALIWSIYGKSICNLSDQQYYPEIINDGAGNGIITWCDKRDGNWDIYAQEISAAGEKEWMTNGTLICNAEGEQSYPKLISDGAGGAIITWYDHREGNSDIYLQRINATGITRWVNNGTLVSNSNGEESDFCLVSDGRGGAIIAWHDNRSGNSDVYAQWFKNQIPISNSPGVISTLKSGVETLNWTLCDDQGTGNYRVLANDTRGNFYEWRSWQPWMNNSELIIDINRTSYGVFNYTIDFYDDQNTHGKDTVIVAIHEPPVSNHPNDINTTSSGSEEINWMLYDDIGGGKYRVLKNNSIGNCMVWIDWTPWINNTDLKVPIDRSINGTFRYIIEYFDMYNFSGVSDEVRVIMIKINDKEPNGDDNKDKETTTNRNFNPLEFLISPFGLGIMGGTLLTIVVLSVKVIKKKKDKRMNNIWSEEDKTDRF